MAGDSQAKLNYYSLHWLVTVKQSDANEYEGRDDIVI